MTTANQRTGSRQNATKVCSDLEWKVEIDAAERLKRKAATRRDSKAAEVRKKSKGKAAANSSQQGSRPKSASAKHSIKRIREQRRIHHINEAKKAEEENVRKRARKCANPELANHPGNIIAAAPGESGSKPEDFFWEVESVIGRRIYRGRVEYLIRWKGCSEDDNTWEPAANLCDTASKSFCGEK